MISLICFVYRLCKDPRVNVWNELHDECGSFGRNPRRQRVSWVNLGPFAKGRAHWRCFELRLRPGEVFSSAGIFSENLFGRIYADFIEVFWVLVWETSLLRLLVPLAGFWRQYGELLCPRSVAQHPDFRWCWHFLCKFGISCKSTEVSSRRDERNISK